MSLKAVELQIAVPRTQDVGRIMEHQQQRQMHDQQYNIDARAHADVAARQKTTDVSETVQGRIKDQHERRKSPKQQAVNQAAGENEQTAASRHEEHVLLHDPFRGRHIDISL